MHPLVQILLALRQDAHGRLHHPLAQRQQEQRGDDVKEGVHVGDLRGRTVGREALHEAHQGNPHQRRDQAQCGKQNRADDIEHQVDDGGPFGVAPGAHRGQYSSDTGTDILTEEDIDGAAQSDHATVGQGLKDTDRGGGGLDQSGKEGTGQDTKHRIRELGHQVYESGHLPQRDHGGAHHVHTNEEDAQTTQDTAVVVELRLFQKYHHGHAQEGKEGRHSTYVQGDELSGDGGTDVGTHDDPHCLCEGHHTGVDEAHHHDRGGGGGLDDSGDHRTHQYAQHPVGRQLLQDALHPVTGRGLQAGAHHLHSVQKQRQAAQQAQNIGNTHRNAPFSLSSL